mmetsp:Transcript_9546/g.21265  ORF Transcript_9546/g.21265 Transcript_9546/m.21265 type:complete len:219 (-) Transcript_9546:2115-2771(-)
MLYHWADSARWPGATDLHSVHLRRSPSFVEDLDPSLVLESQPVPMASLHAMAPQETPSPRPERGSHSGCRQTSLQCHSVLSASGHRCPPTATPSTPSPQQQATLAQTRARPVLPEALRRRLPPRRRCRRPLHRERLTQVAAAVLLLSFCATPGLSRAELRVPLPAQPLQARRSGATSRNAWRTVTGAQPWLRPDCHYARCRGPPPRFLWHRHHTEQAL